MIGSISFKIRLFDFVEKFFYINFNKIVDLFFKL